MGIGVDEFGPILNVGFPILQHCHPSLVNVYPADGMSGLAEFHRRGQPQYPNPRTPILAERSSIFSRGVIHGLPAAAVPGHNPLQPVFQ